MRRLIAPLAIRKPSRLDRGQSQILTGIQTGLHEKGACSPLIFQKRMVHKARRSHADAYSSPPIEPLIHGRRAVEVRRKTAPTPFDPTGHYWRGRPISQDSPYPLAEVPQVLVLALTQCSLGKDQHNLAIVERFYRIL